MKAFKVLLLFLFALLTFNSCSSDDNDPIEVQPVVNTLENDYFSLENGVFTGENLTGGADNFITSLSINKKVINGGTSIMDFTSSKELSKVKVGLKGVSGYYEYELPKGSAKNTGNTYNYDVLIVISQNIIVKNFILEVTFVGIDGSVNILRNTEEVNVLEAGTGDLQISLSWDQTDDLDLHLFNPKGKHIYYANKKIYDGETIIANLDIDSNVNCYIDGINNENIYYNKPINGVYKVYVDLYKKCKRDDKATKYSASINYKGKYYKISESMRGEFSPSAQSNLNTPSGYVLIGTFTINNGILTPGGEYNPTTEQAIFRSAPVLK